jgi:glycosyltransferase involved in cell wall biosynthesis
MKRLVVGIDASRAARMNRTGTEGYSWEIIRRLPALAPLTEFRLYTPNLPKEDMGLPENATWRILRPDRVWSQVQLARELQKNRPDVIFIPAHVLPALTSTPAVVTIHDVAYRYFPKVYRAFDRRYLSFSTALAIARAKKIIVPSAATKVDLVKFYKANANKIVVIPHGYNTELFNPKTDLGKAPMEVPYLFYVGRIEEKKNISLLLRVFERLNADTPVHLVLSGKNGYGFEAIQQQIDRLPARLKSRIHQPGYLPPYDMARYLKHARAFVFPSLYEGFGLPVLEAMAIGTPVVCSDTPALVEISGDAAIHLPAHSVEPWVASIQKILAQPAYARQLVDKGLNQAEKFSWSKAALSTLEVIIHVATKR